MSSLTRGPLSAGVYWRRRLAVLGVAVLLVVGIARLLGAGSDGSSGDDGTARLADASPSSGSPTAGITDSPSTSTTKKPRKSDKPSAPATTTAPPLAVPDGPCVDRDIAVTPDVTQAVAGPTGGVVIELQVRTISDEACTWKVSPTSLTMKITSGSDDIWSSRECPRVLPKQTVTVRKAATTTLTVEWNARRSDEDCSRQTAWALPGGYHVTVAALAGEPADAYFDLVRPAPIYVTETPDPKPSDDGADNKPHNKPGSGQPSGAVEPDSTSQDG
jgi:hypothetical protein